MRIGLISDTHGLLRPEALQFLGGSDHIVHAGDIGGPHILERLALIAPVTAVRGNNDDGDWAEDLAESELLQFGAFRIHVLHDIARLDKAVLDAGVSAIIAGHSHKPLLAERRGVHFVNPGSAGPRRFKLPVSIGELLVDETSLLPRLVRLG